jgi:hypothetical protein
LITARLPLRNAQVGRLFFGSVEPIGQSEQAKNDKHDDQNVLNFHGASLLKTVGEVGVFKVRPSPAPGRNRACSAGRLTFKQIPYFARRGHLDGPSAFCSDIAA